MGKAKYFTTLDLASGYWQIPMHKDDMEKTTFICQEGTFAFRRMPFGLCNAPATFQRMMDSIFRDVIGKYVQVYLDDINIYSETWEEHVKHVTEVLKRLREANLKLKRKKCFFGQTEIEFLGHVLSGGSYSTTDRIIKAIKDYPRCENKKDVQRFVGLCGYYRVFIKDFAKKAAPLYALFKKDTEFHWNELEEQAFQMLKTELLKTQDEDGPRLVYPLRDQEFIVHTDASITGIGAVLAQKDENGRERPIMFASRVLRDPETRYTVTELEALAVKWAVCEQFERYLWGQPFKLYTDHNALNRMLKETQPRGRLAYWIAKLSPFKYKIIHKQGESNKVADALSRHPVPMQIAAAA